MPKRFYLWKKRLGITLPLERALQVNGRLQWARGSSGLKPSAAARPCFYTIYLTRDSTDQRVCSPGAGFNPPEFLSPCGLPVSCCLATSVVQSRSTGCPSAEGQCSHSRPSAGPAWSSLAQDLHGSGRHESGIRTIPLPGTLACAAPR